MLHDMDIFTLLLITIMMLSFWWSGQVCICMLNPVWCPPRRLRPWHIGRKKRKKNSWRSSQIRVYTVCLLFCQHLFKGSFTQSIATWNGLASTTLRRQLMGLEFKGDNTIVFWACPQLENRGWLGRAMVLQGRIQDVWIGGFKLAEGGSICAVWPIFPEIPHGNEII